MCRLMEEVLEEGREEGKIKTAKRLITKDKMTLEDIAECSDLPLEKIRALALEIKFKQ